jgi:hypothetical protein
MRPEALVNNQSLIAHIQRHRILDRLEKSLGFSDRGPDISSEVCLSVFDSAVSVNHVNTASGRIIRLARRVLSVGPCALHQ